MTTPKQALEAARNALVALRVRLNAEPAVQGRGWVSLGIVLNDAVEKADEALASLQGEDAVERVALPPILDDDADFTPDLARKIIAKYQAILATGLLPDEAAIRADEREKCAKVAESECYATTGRHIAAAIRSGGGE